MSRAWRVLVSLRTSAVLLAALAALLTANALLPQAAFDPETYALAVRGSRAARFVLETLGLGALPTSWAFVACLAAFFANLGAVLVDRAGATWRRCQLRPPTAAQLAVLGTRAVEVPGPAPAPDRVIEILEGLGYRVLPVPGGVWGVKNRLAPLGFPLFHASFFALLGAGLLLYLTRDVRTVIVAEGQEVDTAHGAVVRQAPRDPAPGMRVALERVEPRLEAGRPVGIAAAMILDGVPAVARVNHPVERGAVSILVERAGLAPVLWLTDERGYTVDRVVVPVRAAANGLPTRLPLARDLEVVLDPVPLGPRFPQLDQLATAAIPVRVRAGDRTVFEGEVRAGDAIPLGERTLRVEQLRYWVELRVVREHGGPLLVAGLVLAICGIAWRMLLFRREVLVGLEAGRARVAGRGEFFSARVAREVLQIASLLADRAPPAEKARAG